MPRTLESPLHFDLRIAGFADLAGPHTSLWLVNHHLGTPGSDGISSSRRMEQYFAMVCETMEGYGGFEAEALAFKVCVCQPPTKGPRAYEAFPQALTAEPGKAHGWHTSG